ncbi:hypothetical protein [Candidatus Microthrix parvicella]|uniref:hypothetical protein n=1 Tax=Candidatus Neomicrothrix parvicella TaxID=41950 RepID=UPI0012FE17FB|nr:hypothetical protein [Candidatus Microthrix parvicella]
MAAIRKNTRPYWFGAGCTGREPRSDSHPDFASGSVSATKRPLGDAGCTAATTTPGSKAGHPVSVLDAVAACAAVDNATTTAASAASTGGISAIPLGAAAAIGGITSASTATATAVAGRAALPSGATALGVGSDGRPSGTRATTPIAATNDSPNAATTALGRKRGIVQERRGAAIRPIIALVAYSSRSGNPSGAPCSHRH